MRAVVVAVVVALVVGLAGCGQRADPAAVEKAVAADRAAMKAAMDAEVDRRVNEELAKRGAQRGAAEKVAGPKNADGKPPIRMTEDLFKASVLDRTREEVERKYGLPARTVEDEFGTWDGPHWVYAGEFTSAKGQQYPFVQLYFRAGRVALVAVNEK